MTLDVDLVPERAQARLHVLGLPERERAAARADADALTGRAACRIRPTCSGAWPLLRQLLELHGGRVQQLVDDGGGGRLERLLLLRRERAQPARAPSRSRAGGSPRRAGAARPAAAPRRASFCQSRNSRTSRSTRASAAAASLRALAQVGLGHRRAGRRGRRGRRPPASRTAGSMSRGTAMSMRNSGRRAGRARRARPPRRRGWMTMPGAPVPLITMSAARQLLAQRLEGHRPAARARPPAPPPARTCGRRAPWPARRRAPGAARPARSSCPRPPAARSCPRRSPKILRASSTAT